ncbi:MAG: sulfatase-like hydrolase/transferase [Pontixanthobacter sp.]
MLKHSAIATIMLNSASYAYTLRKPNFIFILADDLGAFDLSCYGRPDYQTPYIDSLANRGVLFSQAYANSASCAPTRTALISGRYQNRIPVGTGRGGGYPSATIGYPGSLPSLPGTLKRAGYRTGLIGKWGLGRLPTFSPNKSGYDEFFGLMGSGIDYWSHDLEPIESPGKRIPDFYENEKLIEVEGYSTDLFSDRACKFIRDNVSQPFLLSLHYNAPHWPWQSRADRGRPRRSELHYDGGSPHIYGDMIRAMDDGVGRVLDTLRQLNLENDTLVIFTSDNGGERFSKMWPLRGQKGDLWEGGIRVPLLACWPGRIPSGVVSSQIAMSMDFLPTFASLAGAPTDLSYPPDGIDLSPQLTGASPIDRVVYWKAPNDLLCSLAYPWKYMKKGTHEYLYNIDIDTTEHVNFKNKYNDIFLKMKTDTDNWSRTVLPNMPMKPGGYIESDEALET